MVELQQLEPAGLAYCRAMLAHLLARLVRLATPACHLQLRLLRSPEVHLAHLGEDLEPPTPQLLEQQVAGD
jgi:hypothetical protein